MFKISGILPRFDAARYASTKILISGDSPLTLPGADSSCQYRTRARANSRFRILLRSDGRNGKPVFRTARHSALPRDSAPTRLNRDRGQMQSRPVEQPRATIAVSCPECHLHRRASPSDVRGFQDYPPTGNARSRHREKGRKTTVNRREPGAHDEASESLSSTCLATSWLVMSAHAGIQAGIPASGSPRREVCIFSQLVIPGGTLER
jgi:hypothetical protein